MSAGTVHYYRVNAYNETGNSGYSNIDAAVTFADLPTTNKTITLLDTYYQQGLIKNSGIYNSLKVKLNEAGHLVGINDYNSAINKLNTLINELLALKSDSLDHDARIKLLYSVRSLMDHLSFLNSLPVTRELYPSVPPFTDYVTIEIPGEEEIVATLTVNNLTVNFARTNIPDIASITVMSSEYTMGPIIVNGLNSGPLQIFQDPAHPSVGTLNLKTGEIDITENVLITSDYLNLLGLSPVSLAIPQKGTLSPLNLTQGICYLVGHGNLPVILPPGLGGARFLSICWNPANSSQAISDALKKFIGLLNTNIKAKDIKSILRIIRAIGNNKASESDAWNLLEKLKDVFGELQGSRPILGDSVVIFLEKLEAITGYPCTNTAVVMAMIKYFNDAYTPSEAKKMFDAILEFFKSRKN